MGSGKPRNGREVRIRAPDRVVNRTNQETRDGDNNDQKEESRAGQTAGRLLGDKVSVQRIQ